MLTALILCLFVDMATANPKVFVNHVTTLQQCAETQPTSMVQVIQIMGAIATIDEVGYIGYLIIISDHMISRY